MAGNTNSPVPAAPELCRICGAPRVGNQPYCIDCGLMFPGSAPSAPSETGAPWSLPEETVRGRYRLTAVLGRRGDVFRYRALDHGAGTPGVREVIVVRAPARTAVVEPAEADEA